jgi:FkbM family methyltransferase
MLDRARDLASKAWRYSLAAADRPWRLPWLLWQVAVRRTHAGELLRMQHNRALLDAQRIAVVIDVGAHQGEFASAVAATMPTVRLVCFEPQADLARTIEGRLPASMDKRVFPYALSDHAGSDTFFRHGFTKSSSLLPMTDLHRQSFPWTAESEQTTVDTRRLDDFQQELGLDQLADGLGVLLKLDVQGSELAVLRGGSQVLANVTCVLVETSLLELYAGEAGFLEVCRFLDEAGFRYAGSWDQMSSPRGDAILQQDAFFVRRP